MLTSFNLWYVSTDNDTGLITESAVKFYEGEITAADEMQEDGSVIPVTKYRISRRLGKDDLGHLSSSLTKKEASDDDCILYNQSHFGEISNTDGLITFLNGELAKDPNREPVAD